MRHDGKRFRSRASVAGSQLTYTIARSPSRAFNSSVLVTKASTPTRGGLSTTTSGLRRIVHRAFDHLFNWCRQCCGPIGQLCAQQRDRGVIPLNRRDRNAALWASATESSPVPAYASTTCFGAELHDRVEYLLLHANAAIAAFTCTKVDSGVLKRAFRRHQVRCVHWRTKSTTTHPSS